MDSNIQHTERGFARVEFNDSSWASCSLQDSSAVEDKIWLGMDFSPEGEQVGIINETLGYVISSRMHLTRDQVAFLLPYLQRFVDTGSIDDSL